MLKWTRFFTDLNLWIKVIFCFCVWGTLVNGASLWHDLGTDGVLLRLHLGFFILYLSQVVFILLRERCVCALAVLQGLLAVLSNIDFTFMPLVRTVGRLFYLIYPSPSLETLKIYQYVLVSLAFTLQMLSAYALFSLLPKKQPPVKE
ncbi:MAG: hypothetical protein IKO35_01470 [Elusimicrobiaceae bacterium]|nr:hypothetical protein [Elusimicrobiaceae bacterium]